VQAGADPISAADETSDPATSKDKGRYSLFHPTPPELMRELLPDRPDKTESPYTVDAGHFQLEMDFAKFVQDRSDRVHLRSWNLAPCNLKLGLLNNVDLQLVFDSSLHHRIEDRAARSTTTRSGLGDVITRLVTPTSSGAAQTQSAGSTAPGIADNSFLLEEAYNQEYGVVQHISAFHRSVTTGDWAYSFTQEWPFNPAPRSQLSYTITALAGGAPGAGGGIGDILLNYRYQVLGGGDARVAFAPRASLVVPSGSSRDGRGAGGAGMRFNLPVSWQVAKKVVTHWNAGTTIVPRAKNAAGDTAATYGYSLGQSFIFQASPRFNLMLETLFDHSQSVTAPGRTAWESSVVINPGSRWAHNFESGLQIVPGIAFPVEVGNAGRGNWGVFLYLSFEHPFGKRAP
jgi:hypothetical protein